MSQESIRLATALALSLKRDRLNDKINAGTLTMPRTCAFSVSLVKPRIRHIPESEVKSIIDKGIEMAIREGDLASQLEVDTVCTLIADELLKELTTAAKRHKCAAEPSATRFYEGLAASLHEFYQDVECEIEASAPVATAQGAPARELLLFETVRKIVTDIHLDSL